MLTYMGLLAIACCLGASEALFALGRCPTVQAKSDVDFSMLSGRWQEYSRYPNLRQTLNKCVTFDIIARLTRTAGASSEMILEITGRNELTNGETRSVNSFKTESESNGELIHTGLIRGLLGVSIQVLGTDYTNYAILYSCQNGLFSLYNTQQAWVLTRSTLSPEKRAEVIGILESNNLDMEAFTYTNEIECLN